MKAWKIEKHGGPEVLNRVEVASPKPGPNQVLVQVEAVGLNHLDLWVRNGVPGHKFHLPMVPGGDIAGKVLDIGPGVGELPPGSPVIINPGISCGHCEACLGGFDPICRSYGILGETQNGGCADQVVVPIQNIIPRPANMTAVDGAALGIAYLTAWSMLIRKAQVRAGEIVLIHAGGSGVSSAAIQIAKLHGATVITTVGNSAKEEKARALGADHVIQYKEKPFREEVKKILNQYGKKGCDVVIDHVGTDTMSDSLKCLGWGGRLVTCGATSGSELKIDLKLIFFKNISLLGSTMGSKADMIRIVQLVSEKKLKPVVGQVFPMTDLPKAMDAMEKRKVFGRVVLTN